MCISYEHMKAIAKRTRFDPKELACRRREFGVLLRRLRLARGLSCEELGVKAGRISRTTLATIERGQRQAGAIVGERLADALGLADDERQNFLMAALKTTVGETLPVQSKGLDPEFFKPIWQLLLNHGISSTDGHQLRLGGKLTSKSPEALKRAARHLAEKAAILSTRIKAALQGTDDPFLMDIEVETRDGTILLVQLLPASSKISELPNFKQKPAAA